MCSKGGSSELFQKIGENKRDFLIDINAQEVVENDSSKILGGKERDVGPDRVVVCEEHLDGRAVEDAVPGGSRGDRVAGVGSVQEVVRH